RGSAVEQRHPLLVRVIHQIDDDPGLRLGRACHFDPRAGPDSTPTPVAADHVPRREAAFRANRRRGRGDHLMRVLAEVAETTVEVEPDSFSALCCPQESPLQARLIEEILLREPECLYRRADDYEGLAVGAEIGGTAVPNQVSFYVSQDADRLEYPPRLVHQRDRSRLVR